jgi:hypothetical protein
MDELREAGAWQVEPYDLWFFFCGLIASQLREAVALSWGGVNPPPGHDYPVM